MSTAPIVERKLLLRMAPLIFLLYLLFALDRGNIGFAAKQMTGALGFSAELFGLGSGLFTFAYLLFQVPVAAWLRRLGGRHAFALVACAWGLVSALTAFVSDQAGFLANRFALGVAEAGFNAFVMYYISQMFPRSLRGFAAGLTLFAVPTSMIIASPLSGVLLDWQAAGLQGWQLMFIVEGIPSIIVGLACLRLIPDSVAELRSLTPEERHWLNTELAAHSVPEANTRGGLPGVLANPYVWALGFLLFSGVCAANVMLVWMPLMISQLSKLGNVGVGFLNAIPWLAFGIGCVTMSRLSDRVQDRTTPLKPALAIAACGFIVAAFLQDTHPVPGFAGLVVGAFGVGAAQGVFWSLTMELVRGPAAATAYAVIGVIGNGSGIFAHPVIGRVHDATGSFAAVAWGLGALNVGAIAMVIYISHSSRLATTVPVVQ